MALSQLEYKQITFTDWGEIGLKFFSNLCNALTDSNCHGLLIRWFRVRASGCPFPNPSSEATVYTQVEFD
jgi:hypothetical protein